MKQFNNFRRLTAALGVLAAAFVMTLAGCTKVDDTLGSNLIPDDQQMKAGFKSLSGQLKDGSLNPRQYFETRLYQTDSIVTSNIGYGCIGSMLNDTFGLRTVGFLSQYTSYYKVDSGYFGFKPIFDSAQILLSIGKSNYGGDTTVAQTFCVYEITSNKYIEDKEDSTFFLSFDPTEKSQALTPDYKSKPLFRFKLGGTTGPATKAVTMEPTDEGRAFVKRLMLQDKDDKFYKDYSIYSVDSLKYWVEKFKGLYIAPENAQASKGGATYATALDASGFAVYGRNLNPKDPSLIKDTIGMVYYFYDEYAEHGKVSVNTVDHDWAMATSPAKFNADEAREDNPDRLNYTSRRVYVEGMGGVVTELTFSREFFDELEDIIAYENSNTGKNFSTMAISQARMSIYFTNSSYNWQDITDINRLIDEMSSSASRLGLYTDYKDLKAIEDYPYAYEKQYSTSVTLAYGGYINRSQGCYVMDISAYLQGLWNSYYKLRKSTPADKEVDLDKVENRRIYIAPEAYSLYTPAYTVLQGMKTDGNNAPIKIDLTYNMIK